MQDDWFSLIRAADPPPHDVLQWRDPETGLDAVLVLDDVTLGPAVGGIRTRSYASAVEALRDALELARAMTLKCALGGLQAGGGKLVVIDHAGLDRTRAFRQVGRHVASLGGLFRTAGDLGTTAADLAMVATETEHVHLDEARLTGAVALGLRRCLEAVVERRVRRLDGLRVAIQGCGAIGRAVAMDLSAAGAELWLADLDAGRVAEVAEATGARIVAPAEIFELPVDVVAPCAIGGVIDADLARRLKAWAVCGAANNCLTDATTAEILRTRDVVHVPDVLASAGAVIEGVGFTIMNLVDRRPLIDRLRQTTALVLERAALEARPPSLIAESLARERLAERHRVA